VVMKTIEQEEEYLALQVLENKRMAEEKRLKKRDEKRKRQAKALHWMKCPKCGMDLFEIDCKYTTVDKCSHCDGIWLDAGEMAAVAKMDKSGLEKLFNAFQK